MKRENFSRRRFLKQSVGAFAGSLGLPYIISSSACGKAGEVSPSNTITLGCIGVGSRGNSVLSHFLRQEDVRIVAVCDVKQTRLKSTKERIDNHYGTKDCRMYRDFRELADRDDIDAVLDATTDHWHVLTALAAVRAGKDVYLEKPMGMSLEEDHTLRAECHRHSTVFQFGTQQRSDWKFRLACELALNGRLGKVHTINVLSPASKAGGTMKPAPVPEWLDYNMWLGPAPYTRYTESRCSNALWWFNSDYALGWIAGWGVHPLDIALWGAGEKARCPVELQGRGVFPADGFCDTAVDWRIKIQYDSGLIMNYVGEHQPEDWKKRYGPDSHGIGFEGSKGWVHVNRGRIVAEPESLLKTTFGPEEIHLYKSNHHVRNFLNCIKDRSETVCPIDTAVEADTLCQLSDIAIRTEKKIRWEPGKEQLIVAGSPDGYDPQAGRRLKRSMRSPWHL